MTSPTSTPQQSIREEPTHNLALLRVATGLALLFDAMLAIPAWAVPAPDSPSWHAGTGALLTVQPGPLLVMLHIQAAIALLTIIGVATRAALLSLAGLCLLKLGSAWPWLRFDHLILTLILLCLAASPSNSHLSFDPSPAPKTALSWHRLIVVLVSAGLACSALARLAAGHYDGGRVAPWLSWLPRISAGLTPNGLLSTARVVAVFLIVVDLLLIAALQLRKARIVAYVVLIPLYVFVAVASLLSRQADWLLHCLWMVGVLLALQPPKILVRRMDAAADKHPAGATLLRPHSSAGNTRFLAIGGIAVGSLVVLPWALHWNVSTLPSSLQPTVGVLAAGWATLIAITGSAIRADRSADNEPRPDRLLRTGMLTIVLAIVVACAAILLRLGSSADRATVEWTRHLLASGKLAAAQKLVTSDSFRRTGKEAEARAHLLLVSAYVRLGEPDRIARTLAIAKNALPSHDPELAAAQGALAQIQGKPDKAIKHYRRALRSELTPANLLRLASALSITGQFKKAEIRLRQALILNPWSISARLGLGLVHYRARQMPKALRAFSAATRIAPLNPRAYFFRAGVHQVNRDLSKARADFELAHLLAPDDPDITLALARCAFQQGDREAAQKVLKDFTAKHPNNQQVRSRLDSLPRKAPRRTR